MKKILTLIAALFLTMGTAQAEQNIDIDSLISDIRELAKEKNCANDMNDLVDIYISKDMSPDFIKQQFEDYGLKVTLTDHQYLSYHEKQEYDQRLNIYGNVYTRFYFFGKKYFAIRLYIKNADIQKISSSFSFKSLGKGVSCEH